MSEFSQNLAVVIGIDHYDNGICSLQTAVNDAKELAQILEQDYKYQVVLLVNEGATLEALRHLLVKELPERTQPDDRLLFYFAGHGIALDDKDGPQGYLVPQDARAEDKNRSLLPMKELHDALDKLPCRHFLSIFDCCFAGAFRWSQKDGQRAGKEANTA